MNTQQIVVQAKRELWENKIGFIYAPLIITVLLLLVMGVAAIKGSSSADGGGINFHYMDESGAKDKKFGVSELVEKVSTQGDRVYSEVISGIVYANTALLYITFFIVILAYAHSCLFDDRKNRDILFWRSMPVSETTNVLVKIGFFLLYFPVFILILNIVVALFTLICATVCFAIKGVSISYLLTSIMHSDGLYTVIRVFGLGILDMLLLMPVIGFILLASAYAKKSPFITTSLVPAVLIVMDRVVNYLLGVNLHIVDTLRG
jgi:ABC-2 type transport system permease protein